MTHYDQDDSWFLAQLKPNSAQIANRNLKQQGFQTFLPMEEGTRKRNGKFVSEYRPVFPGYIFVSFNVSGGLWRKIHSTYGITQLVCFGKEPASVPSFIIDQLMLRCDASGKLLPPNTLKPGDPIIVTSGPFADFIAKVDKITASQRIWVLMEIMGGQKLVAVSTNQVRAL